MKLLPVLIIFFISACASSWSILHEDSSKTHSWYHQSGKIVYGGMIYGFKEKNYILRSFFTGRTEVRLIKPLAFAKGSDGRIAIADGGCGCVHLFIPEDGRYITLFKIDSGELLSPAGVAFDESNRLYVSDSLRGKVFIYDSEGRYGGFIDGFSKPTGLVCDRETGILYVVDTLRNVVSAVYHDGKPLFHFGGRGEEPGKFNFPTYIALSDRLYVTDAMNFRIQIFRKDGSLINLFGHHGNGSGDFAMPKGVGADRDGIIYVVDALFDNVQLFNEKGEFLLTLGARGKGEAEFWLPSCIFIDTSENIYICDTYNQRIQVFKLKRER
ncbi:MAG: 6-bladed beta-propeller [Thermodesulfovibrionales bacterium]|nr:6-bladed beta-propeller [Thermodesulfovibrionales bacterium]